MLNGVKHLVSGGSGSFITFGNNVRRSGANDKEVLLLVQFFLFSSWTVLLILKYSGI